MIDFIHTLWNYNYWAHHKLWNCIQTISDDDFIKPVAYSIGSIHAQLVHIMWAEASWYERLHEGSRPTFTAQDYPSQQSIYEKWNQIETRWRIYIANLTDDELNRILEINPFNGSPYTANVFEILSHLVNHATNHRAQILQLIHAYGGETFEQDLSFYYRERQNQATS